MENKKIYSQRIKELRTMLNMTQINFANLIDCAQTALSSYENGNTVPSLDTMINIASSLNVSVDWLCGLTDNMKLSDDLSTYADAFSNLKRILDNLYCYELTYYEEGYNEPPTMRLDIYDKFYIEFLRGYQKMHASFNEGLIDQEILDLWAEKTLKKYKSIPLYIPKETDDTIAENLDDNDLPNIDSDQLPF